MKKLIVVFSILAAVTFSVFANGADDKSAAEKSITVWMINNPVEKIIKAFDAVAVDFENETGIKVSYIRTPTNDFHTRLVTSISAGAYPDVIIWNSQPGIEFSSTGAVVTVDDVIAQAGKEHFGAGVLQSYMIKNKIYEIPFLARPAGIHARKSWLEAAGYSTELKTDKNGNFYMEGLRTWEDIVQAGIKITKASEGKYGLGFGYSRKAFGDSAGFAFSVNASYGGRILDKNGKVAINSRETIAALRFMQNMWKSGALPAACTTWDGNSNNQFFIGGDIGIVFNSNSILAKLNDKTTVKASDVIIIPFPIGSAGRSFMEASPETISIFKTAKVNYAKQFASYLIKPDTQIKMFRTMGFGYYSPLRADVMNNAIFSSLSQNEKVFMRDTMKAVGPSFPSDADSRLTALYSSFLFDDALSRIAVDGWSPEQVADEMEKKVKEAIED